jgi:peroxiredoxin
MDPLIANHALAPDFELPDLQGKQLRLSAQRGHIVVLNFWSAECPWSERADHEMITYLPQWGEDVYVLYIASNSNEPHNMLVRVAQDRHLVNVLEDHDHAVADLFGAQTTPHLFVIDALGELRYQGAFNDITFRQRQATQPYLYRAVAALLAGRDPAPVATAAYGCTIVRHLA